MVSIRLGPEAREEVRHGAREQGNHAEVASPTASRQAKRRLREKRQQQRYGGQKNQQGTGLLKYAPPAGRMQLQIEPQDQIHERRSQKIDVPGNVHQAHFRRKRVDVRDVAPHHLTGKQERDDAEQSDSEVDATHFHPRASLQRILSNVEHAEGGPQDNVRGFSFLAEELNTKN